LDYHFDHFELYVETNYDNITYDDFTYDNDYQFNSVDVLPFNNILIDEFKLNSLDNLYVNKF
jgi:hypothetical protein